MLPGGDEPTLNAKSAAPLQQAAQEVAGPSAAEQVVPASASAQPASGQAAVEGDLQNTGQPSPAGHGPTSRSGSEGPTGPQTDSALPRAPREQQTARKSGAV